MLKRLFLVFALVLVPPALAGCAGSGAPATAQTGVVDTPTKQLIVAEYAYQAALKAIQVEVRAGRLKGERAATVQRYLRLATNALDVARTAVIQGKVNTVALLATAVGAVADLTTQLK